MTDKRIRFIEQLNELHESAGSPSLGRLVKLAKRENLPRALARSTINDILNGKRERPPEWPWVASFVKAVEAAAVEAELSPVPVTMAEWERRWRDARAARPTGSQQPLDELHRRYLAGYGRTGARLVRWAGEGNADASYQLGVIQLLHDQGEEADEWLSQAAHAGHQGAAQLYRDPHAYSKAIEIAFEYGTAYEAEGHAKREIARFFHTMAARCGHAGAARRLTGDGGFSPLMRTLPVDDVPLLTISV
ncbi:hypothetical protein ACFXJ8_31720 [Nonomuraea sp. NPDC059194]|uniref:hypothetical protein n=1 Tax=Nonomuraea sp. NPDC059194 TaxID=3346764 RepID=UPI003684C416